jgi:hypothetical protein
MTEHKQAMEQALAALQSCWREGLTSNNLKQVEDAITALHAVKRLWLEVRPKQVEHYTVPLYAATSAPKEPGRTDGVALPDGAQQ